MHIEWMRERRGVETLRELCAGPGRLTQAYGIIRADNGMDLVAGRDLFVVPSDPVPDDGVAVGPRVGISVAMERPWRFSEKESSFVSRGPSAGPRGPRRPTLKRTAMAKAKVTAAGKGRAKA